MHNMFTVLDKYEPDSVHDLKQRSYGLFKKLFLWNNTVQMLGLPNKSDGTFFFFFFGYIATLAEIGIKVDSSKI